VNANTEPALFLKRAWRRDALATKQQRLTAQKPALVVEELFRSALTESKQIPTNVRRVSCD
jgi:hypothetical protein